MGTATRHSRFSLGQKIHNLYLSNLPDRGKFFLLAYLTSLAGSPALSPQGVSGWESQGNGQIPPQIKCSAPLDKQETFYYDSYR
ncbi:MAG: hypothetical protein F6K40_30490 [Okeania sp. SIO3I5]|uniref:hypothetical protein n=1 Tax=Okeania sp. SIO3I5 TaxID=2607805 RepID=UPI0013BCF862|nr:hypothetical protein [Okeania sp. SIO3I5]NEQ40328.1 hypothetical protein [Okeania sp. SIO3I5]